MLGVWVGEIRGQELLLLSWKFILSDNITIGINKLQRNQRSFSPPLCLLADNDGSSGQLGCFWQLSLPVNIWQTQTKHFNGQLSAVASAASEHQVSLESSVSGLSIPSGLSKDRKSGK